MAALRECPRTLRVLARLMDYPTAGLLGAIPVMLEAVHDEAGVREPLLGELSAFMRELATQSVLELQESYVGLFDRGRALSLHLFEHVHGESRDRGQAMVDLLELYRQGGLELDARELPDYLPLMLEFLSTRPRAEVNALLGDAMPVIVLLGARLAERGSGYAVPLAVLEAFHGTIETAAAMRRRAANEGPDPTIENMDEIWEEEQVTFMNNRDPAGGCGSAAPPRAGPVSAAPTPTSTRGGGSRSISLRERR